jgi:hypothetical protein
VGRERGCYDRVRKVNGRVRREYVGTGRAAELPARLDAQAREGRRRDADARRRQKDALSALDADLRALAEAIDVVARAALLAAGYRQHKRGEWRRRREQPVE